MLRVLSNSEVISYVVVTDSARGTGTCRHVTSLTAPANYDNVRRVDEYKFCRFDV